MFTKSKIFVYILVLFIVAVYFGAHPLAKFYLEKSLTKSIKRPTEITNVNFFPLHIDGIIHIDTFPEGVKVHAEYMGGLSIKPRSLGKVLITSESMGGLVTIDYKDYVYKGVAENVDFEKVTQVLGDRKFIKSGKVNGTFIYYKKKREGSTDFEITDAVLNDVTIDKQVSRVNNAVNLNVLNLIDQGVEKGIHNNKNLGTTTDVDYGSFNISLHKNNNITSDDVALRTKDYRIVLDANVHKKGKINHFTLYLINKKGCAMVKQDYSGMVQRPKLQKTTPLYKTIAKTAPKSMFGIGKEFMGFGQALAKKQGFKEEDMELSNYMLRESGFLMDNTTKVVMPKDCKVLYDGRVKHPDRKQTDLKNAPTSHRLQL